LTLAVLAAASALAACGGPSGVSVGTPAGPTIGRWDWPGYGHDAEHSFTGRTTLTAASVRTLKQAWFFRTGDVVSATPTVVDGTVYVGSWDDWFYAVDLVTGKLHWKYHLQAQNAVTPYPGEDPRDITSDGGLVTSSAWFQPAGDGRPALMIFGGGYTLYALVASTGSLYWRHDYTGYPDRPPSPDSDGARIMSSPVVTDGKVLFGVDTDGQKGSRGYVVAASLDTGNPVWEFQTDTDVSGTLLDDGCGSVWSSGTLLPDRGLVVFSTADCRFSNPPPLEETVIAMRVASGEVAWTFRPSRLDNACDFDFGASANVGLDEHGHTTFLGVGSKDGTYYALDPATGAIRWSTNVVFGGFSGGFIASAAYDGSHIVGATALGDFGRFESNGPKVCDPSNPRDIPRQEPSDHAFDAATGAIVWQADHAASFASTTLAGGLAFDDLALSGPVLEVRGADSGNLLAKVTLEQESWSGVAAVGDALVVGEGTDYDWKPSGIELLTPNGRPPVVPAG
jgi:polyvinyl alcohol dehydrogenase (cytochrome)